MVILKTEREQVGHVFHSVCSTSSQSHVDGSTVSFNSRPLAAISLLKRTRSLRNKEKERKKEKTKERSFKNTSTVCHSHKQMPYYTWNVFNIWSEILQRPAVCLLALAFSASWLFVSLFGIRFCFLFLIYFLQPPQHQLLFDCSWAENCFQNYISPLVGLWGGIMQQNHF